MQRLKDERFANRVTWILLATLVLMLGHWAWSRWQAPPTPAPTVADYFGDTAARADASTEAIIANLQTKLKTQPEDWVAHSQLGLAYLQKARETANPAYYLKAEQALTTALQHQPSNYAALGGWGELALARHDFSAALEFGERARNLIPNRAYAYGLIADAQIELARYDAAAETLQRMVNLRPDLSSYSRIAYLRELHGDMEGAIEAMRQAVEAGGPRAENTLWVRTQLGHLYFHSGRLAEAEAEYQLALAAQPDYVHALAGLARVRAVQGNWDEAIALYSTVTNRTPLAEYVIALGEVYETAGRAEEAQKQFELAEAIDTLNRANGVNTDLELALLLAERGRAAEVVTSAREVYAQRPTTFAADVLAWALYQTGNYHEAQTYAQAALRLGAQDATKFFHAGMIEHALGNTTQAKHYLQQALIINPYFSLRHAPQAQKILQELNAND